MEMVYLPLQPTLAQLYSVYRHAHREIEPTHTFPPKNVT